VQDFILNNTKLEGIIFFIFPPAAAFKHHNFALGLSNSEELVEKFILGIWFIFMRQLYTTKYYNMYIN
jgi:hypothetical protein